MNNDIKEILEKINKQIEEHLKDGYAEDVMVVNELDVLQWRELLDCIANLQLENNQLKQNYKIQLEYDECLENKLKGIKDTCKYYKKYKDEWFEEECKNALDDIRDIVLGGEDNE